jgi:TPP-dependent indolepyruvate ferredoxin oxidoreductase alpha subunit
MAGKVKFPYQTLPKANVVYGDIGFWTARLVSAEKTGDKHKLERAAKRLRQLQSVAVIIEARTCKHCRERFETSQGRKTHEIFFCKINPLNASVAERHTQPI